MCDRIRAEILKAVAAERERQLELDIDGDTDQFDRTNTPNDWVAYISAYAGRAADKMHQRDVLGFRRNMIKVAALAVAAVEAYDRGWVPPANRVVETGQC